jgi:hypothetical protein
MITKAKIAFATVLVVASASTRWPTTPSAGFIIARRLL